MLASYDTRYVDEKSVERIAFFGGAGATITIE